MYDYYRDIKNAPMKDGRPLKDTLNHCAYWEGRQGKANKSFPRGTSGHIAYSAGTDIRQDLEEDNARG